MNVSSVPVGSWAVIAKPDLQRLLDALVARGYRTIGPQLRDGAIVLDEVRSLEQLPAGYLDQQDGGSYRVVADQHAGYFDHVVGPHSLKNYLFPAQDTLQRLKRVQQGWEIEDCLPAGPAVAAIGMRSCDLHALAIQDRVFLEGDYVDPWYRARREGLFVVAVNCRRAAPTCFCHSMNTGPAATRGFDLAMTESETGFFVQVGTDRGGEVLAELPWEPCSAEQVAEAHQVSARLAAELRDRVTRPATADPETPRGRSLNTEGIRDLLLGNLEHPRWQEVAERCLGCANCTLVCPTCFCSTVQEVTDLTGAEVQRERGWASCFTGEHSYMSSGVVRPSIAAQYRQWLTHKLASWIDQFGTSGCVGCGRCITWCPVGIDLTEEVAAIAGETP